MSNDPADFWTIDTSVFFSSFWGWSPRTWGCVGWTGERGRTRRENLLTELTNPFIAVIYVTKSTDDVDLAGKIVGFYLMSHEKGDRNELTDPYHHALDPGKWDHSLKALRAFTYIPEHRIMAADFDPGLARTARAVTKWGKVLTDRKQIGRLRDMPWVEVDVYGANEQAMEMEAELTPPSGFSRAGPANRNGYVVSSSAQQLERQLYILRLAGPMDAYLGEPANGRSIYKIGLSASPEWRRQSLQDAMPRGTFRWKIHRSATHDHTVGRLSFKAAVAGEDAMKEYLGEHSEWQDREFCLASEAEIEKAWQLGCAAARSFASA